LKIRFSNKALKDLEDIWDYTTENWSKEKAKDYTNQINRIINKISVQEVNGVKTNYKNYLKYRVNSHYIIYTISHTLNVTRILHTKMDLHKNIKK
jgi:toxin ParE1/3/4